MNLMNFLFPDANNSHRPVSPDNEETAAINQYVNSQVLNDSSNANQESDFNKNVDVVEQKNTNQTSNETKNGKLHKNFLPSSCILTLSLALIIVMELLCVVRFSIKGLMTFNGGGYDVFEFNFD